MGPSELQMLFLQSCFPDVYVEPPSGNFALDCTEPIVRFCFDSSNRDCHVQVRMLNLLHEKGWASNPAFQIGRNMIGFTQNGIEVLIEYSGDVGYFVDVLVKSSKAYTDALQHTSYHKTGQVSFKWALLKGFVDRVDVFSSHLSPLSVKCHRLISQLSVFARNSLHGQ